MVVGVDYVASELNLRGFKLAESWDDLSVADLALRQKPWVAINCKAPPN